MSALDNALEQEAGRTRAYADWSRAAVAGGAGSSTAVLAATAGGGSILGQLGKNPALSNHAEQLRHVRELVFSCVRAIYQRCAGQPVRLARRLKEDRQPAPARRLNKNALPEGMKSFHRNLEQVMSHPVLDCLERPNQLMVRWSLVAVTIMHLEACGRSYWWTYKNPPASPLPFTVLPLPPSWVDPVHKGDRLYAGWKVSPGNSTQTFDVPAEEIVQLYYPDPANPLAALSPLQAMARAVVADESMSEAQRRSFSNGIWPGLAVTVARNRDVNGQEGARPKLTRDQRKQIIAPILQAYRGVINFDEPIILDGWIENIFKVSQSPREMEFLKSAQVTKERITQGFGVNPIVMGQIQDANRACHDEQTEVLTLRGWLRYDQVQLGDLAGTMNPVTGRFEWQGVRHVHIYPNYDGEMVRLAGAKLDALVTPEHRMWSRRGYSCGQRRLDSPYSFKLARDLRCHDVLPLAPLPQAAQRENVFSLPGIRFGTGLHTGRIIPGVRLPMDAFLEFLGWFVSEGWAVSGRRPTGRQDYTVGVKQAVGASEECRRIAACMRSLGLGRVTVSGRRALAAHETPDGYARQATNTYFISDKRLWTWLRAHCGVGAAAKRLPDFLFRLPGEQLVRTLEALLLGDGSHYDATEEKGYSGLLAMYASKSDELMDQVQTLSLLCGRAARMRRDTSNGTHTMGVSEYSREMWLLPKHISRERYRGTVWCVTVPNGLVITRRNGKPLVSGNSAAAADDHFCLPPGEPVQTKRGFVPIEAVLPGDEVWTGKGRWRPVEESLRRVYRGKMTRVHLSTPNWPLDLTPDHPLWVRTASGTVGWVAAGEVRRGDLVCLPRGHDEPAETDLEVAAHVRVKAKAGEVGRVLLESQTWSKFGLPSAVRVTAELAWTLGLYLAEGHASCSQVVWSVHREERDEVLDRVGAFAATMGLSSPAWTANGEAGVQVRLSSTGLGRLLDSLFGHGAAGKRVPAVVYGWPVRLREQFLAGYLYGDGCVSRQSVSYSSVSLSAAAGVRTLFASLGVPCGLSRYEGGGEHFIQGRRVKTSDVYYVGRVGADSARVLGWMGLSSEKVSGRGRLYRADDEAVWFPVTAVETNRYRGWVYNLRVAEDHSYTTASCVASNCSTCINPKLELLSMYLTAWWLPTVAPGEPDLIAYFEPAHTVDPDFDLKRDQAMVDRGGMEVNEWRSNNGLPDKPGGNVAIRLNTYTVVNLEEEYDFSEEEEGGPPPAGGQGAGAPPFAGGQGGDGGQGGGDLGEGGQGGRPVAGLLEYREPVSCLAAVLEPARQARLWVKAVSRAEAGLAAALRSYFGRVAKEAAAGVGEGTGTARELARRCFSPRAWDRDLKDTVRPQLRSITEAGARKELTLHRPRKASELGDVKACLKAGRLAVPPDVRKAMDSFVSQALKKPYWKDVNTNLAADLEAAFGKAIDEGKSGKELADAVQAVLGPAASKKRAARIARTESTGFMNAGQQASREKLAKLGAITGKKWAALPGKRTRETHAEASGQTVGVTESFTVGGHECQYPGDLELPPEERANCRCVSLSVTAKLPAGKAWALSQVYEMWAS